MPYSTILVHVDRTSHSDRRIRFAAQLAATQDAHLVGVAATGTLHLPAEVRQVVGRDYIESRVAQMRGDARALLDGFESQVRNAGARGFESRISNGSTEEALMLHGRYSDAVVLSRPDTQSEAGSLDYEAVSLLALGVGRPVLLVPNSWQDGPIARRALVAWSATRESVRAVVDALPLLKKAEAVDVAVFNASKIGGHGQEPGADIGLYLARHGVNVTVHDDVTAIDVGNALLSRASDWNSDLIVMGAFGHSRLREIFLGGVSDTVLKSSPVPVLMSH